MKILWIGGSHRRHYYFANTLHDSHTLSGALIVNREEMIPQPPDNTPDHDAQNFLKHFSDRNQAEIEYFGKQSPPPCATLQVAPKELNSRKSVDFVRSIQPDIVIIFGSGLIKDPLFAELPKETINMHLGLSPRYRGAATLFWPFYFLEPQYAGTTFHYIVAEPDAGTIVHQVTPELKMGDGIHDVGAKTVLASTDAAIRLLEVVKRGKKWKTYRQRSTGKNFLRNDFQPGHLRLIYDTYHNRIVDEYLSGNLKSKTPKLFSQF